MAPCRFALAIPFRARRCLAAVLLAALHPRLARAEDTIAYKYQDYRESAGRIAVRVNSALLEKDIGTSISLKVSGIIDAIAGATPNGQPPPTPNGQVPVSQIHERRKAWNAEFSKQFSAIKLSAGAANSRESDYVSHGCSLNGSVDFNQKNTTLNLGVAGTDDDVKVFFKQPWESKRSLDLITGVTQLLDPATVMTLNLTYSHATGYLSDPYKLVQKNVEIIPGIFLPQTFGENRPNERDRWTALAGINRAFEAAHGAMDASYRFHADDFGIHSHTIALEWYQNIGAHFVLRPHVRYFVQNAANFYYLTLTGTTLTPLRTPTGLGPYYSADYRLSSLRTEDYGLKAVWTPIKAVQIDAALERYAMHGRDGVTSPTAYSRATIFTTGFSYFF